jgi:hypothetical protein
VLSLEHKKQIWRRPRWTASKLPRAANDWPYNRPATTVNIRQLVHFLFCFYSLSCWRRYYPRWKTLIKLYCVSLPIVLICTLVAFWVMLESIWKETMMMEWTSTWPKDDLFWHLLALCIVSIPTVIYAVLVWFANQIYRKLATKLTEWGTQIILWFLYWTFYLTWLYLISFVRKSSYGISIRKQSRYEITALWIR